MRHLNSAALVSAGVFLAISNAGASPITVDFTWIGEDGVWSDHLMWAGPVNQYPDSTADRAFISGEDTVVSLDFNLGLGGLEVTNEATMHCGFDSLYVEGDTYVSDPSTYFTFSNGPALRDFDTNTFHLTNEAQAAMTGATMQVDEFLRIDTGSAIFCTGVIEMDSTTGHLELDGGYIWAWESQSGGDTMTLRRTEDSTSKLDMTASTGGVLIWSDTILENELPFLGTVGGHFSVSHNSLFTSTEGFIGAASANIDLNGGLVSDNEYATFDAPWLDYYGDIEVWRSTRMNVDTFWFRGDVLFYGDNEEPASLFVDADTLVFDTATMLADGANTRFQSNTPALSIIGGGLTSITMSDEGVFDLDGSNGNTEITVNDGSTFEVNAQHLDYQDANEVFNGVVNLEGDMHIQSYPGHEDWNMYGDLLLDGGTYTGRRIVSEGLIAGKGSIDAAVSNGGTIEALDGTLWLGDNTDLDGPTDQDGIVRAVTGDIVVGEVGIQFFTGLMEIGDGEGAVREVIEVDGMLSIHDENDARGTLNMNSGRLRGTWIGLYGDLLVEGTSQIRASGNDPAHRVSFGTPSVSTIIGTLELDGGARIYNGATFNGEGLLYGMNVNHELELLHGANTSDVGIGTVGSLHLGTTTPGSAEATIGSLTLGETGSYHIDLGGTDPGTGYDRLNVLDSAALNGSLHVSTFNGFAPSYGDTFVVLEAASISGGFEALQIEGLLLGQGLSVAVTDTQVILQITCPPDIADANGLVDVNDLLLLLANWGTDGPGSAIAAPHDVVDVNDLLELLAAWGSC